ncbi:hypothetical protein HNY73_019018 [Argiope bruennichi]|uniref:MATH domain-containing protein n=1 Tax=Argiope bruennichi TaxID=94029 RepID=A0A8T0EJ26_ARGBR|nr:hypothetical protein HNY73_019018 [Argiope bruennichi]
MDNTRWCLQLWPKNHPNGIHIEFYLVREADKNEPGPIRVAFELSFLDSYGIQLVKKVKEASFQKGDTKGFAEFLEQTEVKNPRTEYLPEKNQLLVGR